MTMGNEDIDAFFAGRIFVVGEQTDGYKYLAWGTHSFQNGMMSGMNTTTTHTDPLDGAFLCKVHQGWLLVAGFGKYNNFRNTYLDDSDEAEQNALSISKLGIPIISLSDANLRVKTEGGILRSITLEETMMSRARY